MWSCAFRDLHALHAWRLGERLQEAERAACRHVPSRDRLNFDSTSAKKAWCDVAHDNEVHQNFAGRAARKEPLRAFQARRDVPERGVRLDGLCFGRSHGEEIQGRAKQERVKKGAAEQATKLHGRCLEG
jgi:hypothetical protein